jgi:AcrR family transcriptional regulator
MAHPRPIQRSRRTAQGDASRERILEAAIEMIADHGFTATSVDALCRRAGIVKTALYWHFGSKDGLLAAVIERVAGDWTEEIQKSVYQAGPNPMDRLNRALDGMRALVEQKPHLLRLLLTLTFERAQVSAETREALRRASARAESAIVRGIEDALGERLPDLDLLANLILAMLQAASVRVLIDPEGTDLPRMFADLRRLLVLAIGHRIQAGLGHVPALPELAPR